MVRIARIAVIDLHAAAPGANRLHRLDAEGGRCHQVELAERLGKSQSFVSKVERGERRLDVIEFCQVVEALGYEPAKLLRQFKIIGGE